MVAFQKNGLLIPRKTQNQAEIVNQPVFVVIESLLICFINTKSAILHIGQEIFITLIAEHVLITPVDQVLKKFKLKDIRQDLKSAPPFIPRSVSPFIRIPKIPPDYFSNTLDFILSLQRFTEHLNLTPEINITRLLTENKMVLKNGIYIFLSKFADKFVKLVELFFSLQQDTGLINIPEPE